MEQLILQRICGDVPIRKIGVNGDDVGMDVMAKFVETQIRLLNNRHYPIIIIFDRERRVDTCENLKSELFKKLNAKGIARNQLVIGIPDRTIENWILSDTEIIEKRYGVTIRQKVFEGDFGKKIIKEAIKNVASYHETTTGVTLFLECRPAKMKSNSKSFRLFANSVNCRWLQTPGI